MHPIDDTHGKPLDARVNMLLFWELGIHTKATEYDAQTHDD